MIIVRGLILALLLLLASSLGAGQQVQAKREALLSVPEGARLSLVQRLEAYLRAYEKRDIVALYDLVSERAKGGLSREEFLRDVSVHPEEELIYSLKILKVSKSELDDFVGGEPIPGQDEGERWSVTGCGNVSVNGAKAKKRSVGFQMWLVKDVWYFQRGGRRVGEEGCE